MNDHYQNQQPMHTLKLLFTIVAVLCCLQKADAQQVYYEMHVNKHLVGEHQCRNLKVIDLRKDKSCIGRSWQSSKWDKKPIVTKKPFDLVLQDAYDKMKDSSRLGDDELVMVLYDFVAVDKSGENDGGIATLFISADIFRGNNGSYRFVDQSDAFYEIFSPRHVTDTLLAYTTKKISIWFSHFSVTAPCDSDQTLYSIAQLSDRRSNIKKACAIYNTNTYPKGIYYTWEQFLNNTPVDTPFIRWYYYKGEQNITNFYFLNEKGKRGDIIPANTYVAVSDGKDIWIKDTMGLVKMRFEDSDFYANRRYKHLYYYTGMIPMVFMFGAIGGVFVGIAHPKGGKESLGFYKARFDPFTKTFIPIDLRYDPTP